MKITETLTVEILEIEEDYPGQADDYRMQRLREALCGFVRRFAGDHTGSPAEDAILTLAVAADILQSLNSQAAVLHVFEHRGKVVISAMFSPRPDPSEAAVPNDVVVIARKMLQAAKLAGVQVSQ